MGGFAQHVRHHGNPDSNSARSEQRKAMAGAWKRETRGVHALVVTPWRKVSEEKGEIETPRVQSERQSQEQTKPLAPGQQQPVPTVGGLDCLMRPKGGPMFSFVCDNWVRCCTRGKVWLFWRAFLGKSGW